MAAGRPLSIQLYFGGREEQTNNPIAPFAALPRAPDKHHELCLEQQLLPTSSAAAGSRSRTPTDPELCQLHSSARGLQAANRAGGEQKPAWVFPLHPQFSSPTTRGGDSAGTGRMVWGRSSCAQEPWDTVSPKIIRVFGNSPIYSKVGVM